MVKRFIVNSLAILITVASLAAAEKKLPIEQTSNELIDISATVLVDKEQIQQELGSDLGGDIVVVRVTVRPVSDKPILLSLDDFLLVSSKDGQRSQPYAPTQLAGSATLVVSPGASKGTEVRRGPSWGGIVGIGGGGVGNSGESPKSEAKVESKRDEEANPLLAKLEAKVLPEKEIHDSVSGLLYFQIVGKVKPKDLELHYKGAAGRLALRFRP
jgi:hypothetical protein